MLTCKIALKTQKLIKLDLNPVKSNKNASLESFLRFQQKTYTAVYVFSRLQPSTVHINISHTHIQYLP
jgi:hypothetical protein